MSGVEGPCGDLFFLVKQMKKPLRATACIVLVTYFIGTVVCARPSRKDLIDFVDKSATNVKNHNKDAWLDMFTPDGQVNDPVGTPIFAGREERSKFYDAMIKPNDISFDVEKDVVSASRDGYVVLRVAHINAFNTGLGKDYTTSVPLVIRYRIEVTDEDNSLQLTSLNAFWSMANSMSSVKSMGLKGIRLIAAQTADVTRAWGVGLMLRYFKSGTLDTLGEKGESLARGAIEAYNQQSKSEYLDYFSDDVEFMVPGGKTIIGKKALADLYDSSYNPFTPHHMYVSGYNVVVFGTSKGGSNVVSVLTLDSTTRKITSDMVYADDYE